MIKIFYTRQSGVHQISSVGHAPREVCASVGSVIGACILGLKDLVKQHPEEIWLIPVIDGVVCEDWYIDSKDTRPAKLVRSNSSKWRVVRDMATKDRRRTSMAKKKQQKKKVTRRKSRR